MAARLTSLRRLPFTLALFFSLMFVGCSQQPIPTDPKAQLDGGWAAYRLGDYATALRNFEAAAKSPDASETQLQALYGLAAVWNFRRPGEDPAKAAELYTKITTLAPKHDLAAWSFLALARMKHVVPVGEEPDVAEVRKAYQACIDRFPMHLAGEEAFVYQQSTYVAKLSADDAQKAAAALQVFVAQHKSSPFISAAWLLLAEAHTILKQPEKALAARIRSLESEEIDPSSPLDQALTLWQIATMAEFDAGDFKTARVYYSRLIAEYPNDMKVFAAKAALKRMDAFEAKLKAELAAEGGK